VPYIYIYIIQQQTFGTKSAVTVPYIFISQYHVPNVHNTHNATSSSVHTHTNTWKSNRKVTTLEMRYVRFHFTHGHFEHFPARTWRPGPAIRNSLINDTGQAFVLTAWAILRYGCCPWARHERIQRKQRHGSIHSYHHHMQGMNLRYPFQRMMGGPQGCSGGIGEKEKELLRLPESNLHRPVRSPVTISTELSRPPHEQ